MTVSQNQTQGRIEEPGMWDDVIWCDRCGGHVYVDYTMGVGQTSCGH
jgi:hypothetical protein